MACYKNKLNEYQLNILNLVENFEIRKSLMSVLSYMTTVNNRKNEQYKEYQLDFLKKDPDKLKISFSELHELYIKNHQKISLQTLKNRIEMLISLKLLVVISKVKKTNMYQFVLEKANIVSDNVSNIKSIESTENTSIKETNNSHKYSNSQTTLTDLDSNNSTEFDYESYVAAEQKVTDWDMVCSKLTEVFQALKVRSSWVKEKVISKLAKYYKTITVKHLETYICRAVDNARKDHYRSYETNVKNNKVSAPLRFNNFEPRSYDYNTLEKMLLGWEDYYDGALIDIG